MPAPSWIAALIVLASLLSASNAAAVPTWLVYGIQKSDGCEIWRWDPKTARKQQLAKWATCDRRRITVGGTKVFGVQKTAIEVVDAVLREGSKVELPPMTEMGEIRVGLLGDSGHSQGIGALTLGGQDDSNLNASLFARSPYSNQWVLKREWSCRLGYCGPPELDVAAWHAFGMRAPEASLHGIPLYVDREPRLGDKATTHRLEFGEGEAEAALELKLVSSSHTDGYLLFDLVHIRGEERTTLTDNQCYAGLHDGFLVLVRFGGPTEVFDLTTGESLFGEVAFATWVPHLNTRP